jgi:hypothetical protein
MVSAILDLGSRNPNVTHPQPRQLSSSLRREVITRLVLAIDVDRLPLACLSSADRNVDLGLVVFHFRIAVAQAQDRLLLVQTRDAVLCFELYCWDAMRSDTGTSTCR